MEAATARRTRGKTGGTGRENLRQDAAGQSHPRRAGVRHPLHPLPALANGLLRPDHRLAALTGRKSEHRQRGAQLPVADGLPARQNTLRARLIDRGFKIKIVCLITINTWFCRVDSGEYS